MLKHHGRLIAKCLLLFATGAWLLLLGLLVEPRNLHVEEVEAALPGWPEQAAPARVVLLADIHAAIWDGGWLDRVVETTLALNPEAVFLLGDYCFTGGKRHFSMREKELERHLAPLGKRCPVYFVTGNHDLFVETIWVSGMLTRCGFVSLTEGKDQEFTFANGCKLRLRGGPFVPETRGCGDLYNRFKPEKEGENRVPLLSVIHNPYHFMHWKMAGDLTVGGHTHGGQICWPGGTPMRKQGPVSISQLRGGWHRSASGKTLYVSRGIGTTLLPLRYNCPPEITLLILKGKGEE